MFDHVDGLQKVIVNAGKTTGSTATTTQESISTTDSVPEGPTTSIFAIIAEEMANGNAEKTAQVAPAAIV